MYVRTTHSRHVMLQFGTHVHIHTINSRDPTVAYDVAPPTFHWTSGPYPQISCQVVYDWCMWTNFVSWSDVSRTSAFTVVSQGSAPPFRVLSAVTTVVLLCRLPLAFLTIWSPSRITCMPIDCLKTLNTLRTRQGIVSRDNYIMLALYS